MNKLDFYSYITGYFEADGWIYIPPSLHSHHKPRFDFSGTDKDTMEFIYNGLIELNYTPIFYKETWKKKAHYKDVYRVYIGKELDFIRLTDVILSLIVMSRKKETILKCRQYYKDKKNYLKKNNKLSFCAIDKMQEKYILNNYLTSQYSEIADQLDISIASIYNVLKRNGKSKRKDLIVLKNT